MTSLWKPSIDTCIRESEVNPQNTAKFSRNLIKYVSVQHLSYWGCLLAANMQIYRETSSLKWANNVQKLPGIDYVAKIWALAMMLTALLFSHFWSVLLLKERTVTSVKKTLKTLVWSAQKRSIPREICSENSHKIGLFYRLFFSEVCRINSRKIPLKSGGVFTNLSLKIPQNLTFFPVTYMYQKPCLSWILEF